MTIPPKSVRTHNDGYTPTGTTTHQIGYQVTKALGLLPRSMHLSADCSHKTQYYVASSLQQDAEDERVRSDVINMSLLYIVDLLHNDTICARSDIPIPVSSLHIAQVRIPHSSQSQWHARMKGRSTIFRTSHAHERQEADFSEADFSENSTLLGVIKVTAE